MSEVEKLQNTGIKSGKNSEESQAEEAKYLTFWTDGELFGIPICDVVQIVGMQEITPLPDFPDYARGVINLRGSIIPVIDMRIRLKRPEASYSESTCIIVTSVQGTYLGFIVDTVDEVADIKSDKITPPPKVSKEITNRYLTGIGQIGKKVVLMLDVSKILSESIFDQISQMAKEAEASQSPAGKQDSKQEKNSQTNYNP
jgi:purine-binding chemotaxis protein CheW